MNVFGGFVLIGYLLGVFGVCIFIIFNNVFVYKDVSVGMVVICNGGGGVFVLIIEKVQ